MAVSFVLFDPELLDVFICHASEDKATVVRPLYQHLMSCGIRCWIDEAEIAWGDSVVGKVQEGLAKAKYVIVVLSPNSVKKKWPLREIAAALNLEIGEDRSLDLPLICGDPELLLSSLPFIKEKRYLRWSGDSTAIENELRVLERRYQRGR